MRKTPFHLVEMSPWPLTGSLAILTLPVGLILWLRTSNPTLLLLGLVLTSFIAFLWWRDITRESTYQGHHTSYVVSGLKLGMALFIVSEVCFFFAFFWAYFHSSLAPTIEIGSTWPPIGINPLPTFGVPLLNTSVLLLSGVSVTWAHHAIEEGKYFSAIQGLTLTVLLGTYFLFLQYGEYAETTFTIADSIYGSTFFMTTGFHGLHVLVGTTFLLVCTIRLWLFHFSKTHHVGFLAAAWYWHFVDVVWLFLYVSVYWWGSYKYSLIKALIL
uniref:Cytochrome c oxidase subunit 3 n=1 Tax=Cylindrus obtusus TaxID=649475 RepID=I1T1X7_9EUPU|nr:cytochrome c oxidase subunit III [Cylindrus obtusus]AEK48357.1 cytochrome c oxidase subunit 3 [Cylindrus obtusus]